MQNMDTKVNGNVETWFTFCSEIIPLISPTISFASENQLLTVALFSLAFNKANTLN